MGNDEPTEHVPEMVSVGGQMVDKPFISFQGSTLYTRRTEADEYIKVSWDGTTRYLRLYS